MLYTEHACFTDGPLTPVLTQSGNRPVGQTTFLLPGTTDTFFCSAECYPACTFVWFFKREWVATNGSYSISTASIADEGVLECVPYNPVTQNYATVQTNIELTGKSNTF